MRGLITLGILEKIEEMIQARTNDASLRISDHFDLIAGTSTGSIIATGLALGWDVATIRELYIELCPKLFKPNRRLGIMRPRFDVVHLEEMLYRELGETELGSDKLRTGLLICAKRMDTDSAWLLTNHPNSKFYDADPTLDPPQSWRPNKHYQLRNIIRASTAAPSYLEPVEITISDKTDRWDREVGVFVDGAISGHNCPALAAFKVATLESYGFSWPSGEDNLSVLSIGTGIYRERHKPEDFVDQRTVNQAVSALKGMINESQKNTLMVMQAMSRSHAPWYINSEVGGMQMDLVMEEPLVRFRHVDASLERADVARYFDDMPERKLAKALERLRDMAYGRKDNLENCLQIGRYVAEHEVSAMDLFY